MPDQNEVLVQELLNRNQILGSIAGQAPAQKVPAPLPQSSSEEMTPIERALFMKETGIQSNPYAQDIYLPPSIEELLKRADALISQYKEQ